MTFDVYKKAKDMMSIDLVTVDESTQLIDFKNQFQQRGIHHILVTNQEQKLTGIISTEDIIHNDVFTVEDKIIAKDIMTHDPVTVKMETPLIEILKTFLTNNFRALPVLNDKNNLEGILTPFDVMTIVVEDFEDHNY